jgi:SAM-dependent methyltransferase
MINPPPTTTTTTTEASLAKWRPFYTNPDPHIKPPWETTAPSTFVLDFLSSSSSSSSESHTNTHTDTHTHASPLPPGAKTIELGCGVGLTSIYLANVCGFEATAIDLVEEAVARGKEIERELRKERHTNTHIQGVNWIVGDMFTLLSPQNTHTHTNTHTNTHSLVIDIQCCHIFSSPQDRHNLITLTHTLLKPGGYVLVVVGNDREPPRVPGPPVMSKEELVGAYVGRCVDGRGGGGEREREGEVSEEKGTIKEQSDVSVDTDTHTHTNASPLFRLVSLREGRFDATPAYGACPPLCYVAVFQKI